MSEILLIEDEGVIRGALQRLLQRHGYQVHEAGSIAEALPLCEQRMLDLIIADLRLPGEPGTAIIPRSGGVPVLIMTSYASVRSAVDAMKLGAADYIAKPFDHDEMVLTVARLIQQQQLARQNQQLRSELSRDYPVGGMIGSCQAMQQVFERIHKVAPSDASVLILGESGTGKELVARALHEQSRRSHASVVAVNCAAIPEGLIESELFGHERGAFTGANRLQRGLVEAADGGTLFLDEIGELPLEAQARLLRVLQEGEIRRVGATQSRHVDIRLVAATHRDLRQRVADALFREDLYFRLHVVEIELPPLRQRGDDVVELAHYLLEKSCARLNRPPMAFAPCALRQLRDYHWPGNVRELQNVIERAVILADSSEVAALQLALPLAPESASTAPTAPLAAAPTPPVGSSLDDYFVRFVREHQQQLTETELARRLGISRKTLWERRQRLGIPRRR